MLLYCPTVKLSYSNVGNLCWQRFFPQPATTIKKRQLFQSVFLFQFAGRLDFLNFFPFFTCFLCVNVTSTVYRKNVCTDSIRAYFTFSACTTVPVLLYLYFVHTCVLPLMLHRLSVYSVSHTPHPVVLPVLFFKYSTVNIYK